MNTILAAILVCSTGSTPYDQLLMNLETETYERTSFCCHPETGTFKKNGMNWAGQIYQLTSDAGEIKNLIPNHFDGGAVLTNRESSLPLHDCHHEGENL